MNDAVSTAAGGLQEVTILLLLVVVAALLGYLVNLRRRESRQVRGLVSAIEGLRTGRGRGDVEKEDDAGLGMVADAVRRLGQELTSRQAESRTAATRLKALMRAAPATAVVTADRDGNVTSMNDIAEEKFGFAREEVAGVPASVLFSETSWQGLLPKLARRDLAEHGLCDDVELVRKDGEAFHAELHLERVDGAAHDRDGYLMAFRDVTDRVELQRELRATETRYRRLVEGIRQGVAVVRDGRTVFANGVFADMIGRPLDGIVDRPFTDWLAVRDLITTRERLEALESGEPAVDDFPARLQPAADRTVSEVRIRAAAIEQDGHPATLLVLTDESLTRRVQAELRSNEARLDAVLEASSDALLVLAGTREGGVVHLTNRAFLDLFGLDAGDVLGASCGDVTRRLRGRGQGAEQVADLLERSGSDPARLEITLGGEPTRELDVSSAPLGDRKGHVLGRILACRDLTDQKVPERRLEARADELRATLGDLEGGYRKLQDVHAEVERRAAELDALNQELRQLDEMKSQLLANVSHELQTPLVSIRGYTEMTLKERLGPLTEEQRRGLELSLRNIDRLISMIDGLLEFSRMEREIGDLRLSDFSLREVVEDCHALLRPKLEAAGLRWSAHLPDPDLIIHGDRDRIHQVFLNLLGNAAKFNREGGEVEVSARPKSPGFALVHVRDTGVGIAPEDLDRVFERFYRAGATEQAEGSGIGLSIVRNLLRMHGGTIRVDSEPGTGSTFSFTLPLAGGNEAESDSETEPMASVEFTPPLPPEPEPETAPDLAVERDAQPAPASGAEPEPEDPPPSPDDDPGRAPRLRIIRPTG